MTGPRTFRVVGLVLWALCLVGTAGGHVERGHHPVSGVPVHAAVGVLSAAADSAVVPPRAADELRVAATATPLRILVVAAVLAMLAGLGVVPGLASAAVGRASQPLRARRWAISLRAPPLQLA